MGVGGTRRIGQVSPSAAAAAAGGGPRGVDIICCSANGGVCCYLHATSVHLLRSHSAPHLFSPSLALILFLCL